jgi:tripartite-type tricarboxylate transporter receptor subunit TctC
MKGKIIMSKFFLSMLIIVLSFGAMAQSYPTKPVKIVLSVGVGSGPDVVARRFAEVLSERWKQSVVVENHPGGSGVIGLNAINKEAPTGYTIGFLDGGTVVAYAELFGNNAPISMLEPVAPVFDATMALFTSNQTSNFEQVKQRMLTNPSYSSWNVGSVAHVLGAELASTLSPDAIHIPYKEFGQWQADVASQNVTFAFGSTGTTKGMVQAGKTKLIAVASDRRDPRYPNIPTIKELTGKNMRTIISWCAFYVPANVPANIKAQLNADIRAAALDPRVQETLTKFDYIPIHSLSSSEFNNKIKNDQIKYKEIVSQFNIKP